MTATKTSFLDELHWRGLLHQTAGDGLGDHLSTPGCVAYAGFDPTGDSLTIGNFIPIKMLMHWQRAGHKPIVVMGGGTGLIGDPSGKEEERQLRSREEIAHNVESQRRIFEKLLDFDPANPNAAVILNNLDWLDGVTYIDMLRDVGKHFSVNMMIQKESVSQRLTSREQGISYTEFSYMILQAYDFLYLYDTMNCTVQIGGSDQFGNIVAGMDLIRRMHGGEDEEYHAYGITAPLVTKADGSKIGKTETGAVWLTADRTSPYRFYQYWINVGDDDVIQFLKWFTLLGRDEIDGLAQEHAEQPHKRIAQHALAEHMTALLHGRDELARVKAASEALFSGDVREIDDQTMNIIVNEIPQSRQRREVVVDQPIVDVLTATGVASSKRQAREFIQSGAIAASGVPVTDVSATLDESYVLHGRYIPIRRGKKTWLGIELI